MKRMWVGMVFIGLHLSGQAWADPVWDPTEIARLSQQAAQLATNLSTTIVTLRTFDRLTQQIGAGGARSFFTSPSSSTLSHYAGLAPDGGPAAADAAALLSGQPLTASLQQQRRRAWHVAFQKVAAEGLATAQVVNLDAGGAVSRSKSLAANAANAGDLRADLQANSAVGLAVLSELGSQQAVLAMLLEQQSLARLTLIANNGAGP